MPERRSRGEVKPMADLPGPRALEIREPQVRWLNTAPLLGKTLQLASWARLFSFGDGRKHPALRLTETMKEQRSIGDGFLDELLEQKQLGTIDDGINALLESLQWGERLKRISEENDRCVAALAHGHVLQRPSTSGFH